MHAQICIPYLEAVLARSLQNYHVDTNKRHLPSSQFHLFLYILPFTEVFLFLLKISPPILMHGKLEFTCPIFDYYSYHHHHKKNILPHLICLLSHPCFLSLCELTPALAPLNTSSTPIHSHKWFSYSSSQSFPPYILTCVFSEFFPKVLLSH